MDDIDDWEKVDYESMEKVDEATEAVGESYDKQELIKHAFDTMMPALPMQLMKQVKALPVDLQETLAFFTNFRLNGTMDDLCRRPQGVPVPFVSCSCIECLDVYHQRWAEAEEEHWNLMNRFIAFYDSEDYHGTSGVKIYGTKHDMMLASSYPNGEVYTNETAERVLFILASPRENNEQDENKVADKVIASGPRLTNPYPSSYVYISSNGNVDIAHSCQLVREHFPRENSSLIRENSRLIDRTIQGVGLVLRWMFLVFLRAFIEHLAGEIVNALFRTKKK